MKFLLFVCLLPLSTYAMDALIPESSGNIVYNEAGWDISSSNAMNPWTRQFYIGQDCKGEHCPGMAAKNLQSNAAKLYDFIMDRGSMTVLEFIFNFGINPETDASINRGAQMIIGEIKDYQAKRVSKEGYVQIVMNYARSSNDPQNKKLKIDIIAEMVRRMPVQAIK